MTEFTNHPSSLYAYGELDCKIFERLKSLSYHPEVIFDIGASNGAWSRTLYPVMPEAKYHLFEPLIDFYPDYKAVMDETLTSFSSFQLHKYAMGESSGEITMSMLEGNIVGSTALDMTNSGLEVTPVSVKMLSVDDAIASLGLPVPQVIKIDAQGCELSILKGSKENLTKIGVLFLECWLYRGYGKDTPLLTELAEWLLPFGFRLWDIGDEYRNEQGILTTLDCAFVNVDIGICESWYY